MEPKKHLPQDDGGMAGADPVHATMDAAHIASLEKQVKDLQEQVSRLTDIAARAQADLQNAKQRMQRDGDDLRKYATEAVIQKLLPTIDTLRRASEHLPMDLASHEWAKGVLAIEQDLMRTLQEIGLKRMEVMGQQADTARHDVITVGPGTEGEVIEVFEDGYELQGKVLRPAKVKVGGGGA